MASPTIASLAVNNWGTGSGPASPASGLSWNTGDVIIFYAGGFHSGGAGPTFTPSGGTGLTWVQRKTGTNGSTIHVDYWIAVATSTVSGTGSINIAQSAGGAQGAYILAKIIGAVSPFDSNASVPDILNGSHTNAPITTNNPDDLLFVAAWQASTATNMTTPSGWTAGPGIACSISLGGIHSATLSVSVTQSAKVATFGSTATGLVLSDAFTSDSAAPTGTITQVLKLVTQAASGWHSIFGTAAQTLKLVTQAASGWAEALGSASQTLKLITQAAAGAITGTNGVISQTLKLVTQSASGWHSIFGTAAQTLKLVTQSAVGLQWVTGPIVQTLKLVRQSASGAMWAKGAAAMTLKVIRQTALGVLGSATHGNIAQTLKLIRQTGLGQQWTTGPIVQTLKLVRQSAQGWHTIFGAAVQLLFRPQQLLNGFELTLDTLFAVSKVQLNAVVAVIEKQIRSTWHGPPDDPLPPLV